MRTIHFLIFFLLLIACRNTIETKVPQLLPSAIYSTDSFQFQNTTAYLEVFRDQKGNSFQLICWTGNTTFLDTILEQPPLEVKAINIFGDSLPELVLNDCLGCDLGRIRLFVFDKKNDRFFEMKGTNKLLSEIYTLNGVDLIYNIACFNRGGCESTLLKVVGDTCLPLANMFVPYSKEPIQIKHLSKPSQIKFIQNPTSIDTDSLIPILWRNYLLKEYDN